MDAPQHWEKKWDPREHVLCHSMYVRSQSGQNRGSEVAAFTVTLGDNWDGRGGPSGAGHALLIWTELPLWVVRFVKMH